MFGKFGDGSRKFGFYSTLSVVRKWSIFKILNLKIGRTDQAKTVIG